MSPSRAAAILARVFFARRARSCERDAFKPEFQVSGCARGCEHCHIFCAPQATATQRRQNDENPNSPQGILPCGGLIATTIDHNQAETFASASRRIITCSCTVAGNSPKYLRPPSTKRWKRTALRCSNLMTCRLSRHLARIKMTGDRFYDRIRHSPISPTSCICACMVACSSNERRISWSSVVFLVCRKVEQKIDSTIQPKYSSSVCFA